MLINKYITGLEINEKMKENVKNHLKKKLCLIRQISTSRKINELEKGMSRLQKPLTN